MIAAMLAAVLASTMGGVSVPAVGSVASVATTDGASTPRNVVPPGDEPAVRVTLNSQNVFDPGDRARVRVHVRDDSYLVVLHATPSGMVQVLYPTNPGDDDFVHANTDVDVQGNGMDASFVVANTRGAGTVYAAVSRDPFHFDGFSSGAQWAANELPDTAHAATAEAVMTDVVQRMATAGGRFDYDLVTYTVTPHHGPPSNTYANAEPDGGAYAPDWGAYGPSYDPWYDPWYGPEYGMYMGGPWGYNPWWGYSPWYYGPGFYGAGFGLGVGFGLGFGGGCWSCGYGGYGYYGGYYPGYFHGGPFLHRPGFVPPVGYVTHGALFASGRGLGGVGYVSRGFAARPAMFASAHFTTAPGGIARSGLYHSAMAPTVFRQVRSSSQVAHPGLGRVVATNDGAQAAHGMRATPVPEGSERASTGERAVGERAVGTRVGGAAGTPYRAPSGGAAAFRAPARAYRVAPQARSGGEGGYDAPRGGGGERAAPRGGGGESRGGGGGHAHMSSYGGGGHAGGGHFGGGGGHGGGHR
jgi:hypothetical protein